MAESEFLTDRKKTPLLISRPVDEPGHALDVVSGHVMVSRGGLWLLLQPCNCAHARGLSTAQAVYDSNSQLLTERDSWVGTLLHFES